MFARLLLLFLITPIVELFLLVQLGDVIGLLPTMALIVVTGVAGSYLAKREGLSVWSRFNERLQRGELPGRELVDGMIILVSGALLITPGVLTDVVGFIGLLPPTRALIRSAVDKRLQRAVEKGSVRLSFGGFQTGNRPSTGRETTSENGWQGRPRETPHYRSDDA